MSFVVGEDHAAVAVAAQWLGREKTGGGDLGQGAGFFAVLAGAEALGGVFQDEQVVFVGDGLDGLVIGGLAEQVHRDDPSGRQFFFGNGLADRCFQFDRIDVERFAVDVDENRRRAQSGRSLRPWR